MGKKRNFLQDFWEENFNPIGKPSQNSLGIAPIRDIPLKAILFHCKITHFVSGKCSRASRVGKKPFGMGKKRDFHLCWSLRIRIGVFAANQGIHL
ncbi:hypothetical protein CDAR_608041 [Caerostris darwini]|uniref:Uncharacterized protein n=1 Tax=Caerostris darwini TaxID=1538125 RepID=A0AAV4TEG2_9ARAC|nr:hypothetical protein CDAR_608041 [Caerostris darwini]